MTINTPASGTNQCAAATAGNPTCESAFATLPDVFYSFTATQTTMLMTITETGATGVGYAVYDACGGSELFCNSGITSGAANSLTGLTVSSTYWVRVETDQGNEGSFDIVVFEPCQPAGSTAIVLDCANDQFFIDVNVTSLGTSTDVDITTDFVGDTEPTGVGTGITQIGPYPAGTAVVVTLVHDNGGACNLALASTSGNCPPPNDDCVNAIAVGCNSLTPGTTLSANGADNPGATCGTSSNTTPGVWYTVTGWGGSMTASLCGSTTTDTKMQVLTGACGAFTCVAGNDDACSLQSAVTWTSTLGTTYYIYVYAFSATTGYNFILEVACGDENPPCSQNTVTMHLETDNFGSETSYEITPIGLSTPVCSGSGFSSNSSITETCCLPDGCYRLRVFDSFGDGMSLPGGGYVLRDGNGDRIIDNEDNGANFTSESSIANNGSFCLPLSTDRLLDQNTTGGFGCDRMDYSVDDYLIAKPNPAVGGGTDGYQFWIFDPNGTYTRRVLQTNPANNGWSNSDPNDAAYLRFGWLQTMPVPTDILLNVRIRTRVGGTFGAFGPACRMMVLSTPPACPTTKLNDNPNSANFSCGVTRTFGFSDKVVAFPVSGANLYRFRFENTGEGYLRNITSPTATRILNWGTLPLVDGSTYQVQVQASFDSGTNWCPLGPVCTVTIANPPAVANSRSLETSGTLNMWPNPNRGDQLYLTIDDLPEQDLMVTVDIFDMYGKRVSTRSIATQGGLLNTVIELNNELASGLYMVNIAAGEQLFTQRLVIQ